MRLVQLLKSKIHNIEVFECVPDYIGSIEIPEDAMFQTGLYPNELVHVWAINHKARIQTYVIPGKDGRVRINGGAAHHFTPGDRVVIAAFQWIDSRDTHLYSPKLHILE